MIFYSKMIEKIEKCPYFSIKNGILLVFFEFATHFCHLKTVVQNHRVFSCLLCVLKTGALTNLLRSNKI